MKIGIDATDAFFECSTGIGEYAKGLVKGLIKNHRLLENHEIILFKKANQENSIFNLPANWKLYSIKNFPILATQIALLKTLRRTETELIISPSKALPLLFKGKSIYVFHGAEIAEVPEYYGLKSRIIDRCLIKKSIAKAHRVVAVSQTSLKKARRFYNLNPSKAEVIYEGVEFDITGYAQSGEKIKENLSKLKPFILYLGSLESRKNLVNLIKAFDLFKKTGQGQNLKQGQSLRKKTRLVLAGQPGYGYKEIKKAINESGNKGDIIELGYVDQARKDYLLKEAVCLVNISWAEGFNRPVLEALARQTPVIVSDIEVFRELYGDWAYFTPCAKPRKIASALENVYMSFQQRQREMTLAAYVWDNEKIAKLKKIFNWERVGEEMAKVIDKMQV